MASRALAWASTAERSRAVAERRYPSAHARRVRHPHVRRFRAGRLLPRPVDGPPGHRRHPLHRAGPGARRHPLLPLRLRGGGAGRRVPPRQGHDLQARGVRQRPGRGQGRHRRRPPHAAQRGPAAGLRPVHRGPQRPLPHRRGRRHLPGRHGPHPPRDPPRHRGQRVAGRLGRPLPRHRPRRAVGHAGGRRAAVGLAVAGRAPRRRRRGSARSAPPSSRHLDAEGAKVTVADVDEAKVGALAERFGTMRVVARGGPRRPVRHLLALRAGGRAQLGHRSPR